MRGSRRRLGLVAALVTGCFNPEGGGSTTTTTSEGTTAATVPTTGSDATTGAPATTGGSSPDPSTSGSSETTAPPDVTTTAATTGPVDPGTTTSDATTGTSDTSGTSGTTGNTEKTCGDEALQGEEECDDGNLDPGDGCTPTCEREALLIFATSAAVTGGFGGVAVADTTCRGLAALASQPPLKGRKLENFVAFVSAPGADVLSRVHDGGLGYVRPKDLTIVAKNYLDLVNGSFAAPVLYDEQGTEIMGTADCGNTMVRVWTGTQVGGTTADDHCGNWMDTNLVGQLGYAVSSGPQAIAACGANCLGPARFYCVENP